MTASAPTRPSEASAPSTALTLPAQTSQPPAPPLVRYDTMCRAIAECHRIDEVKELRDQARALEIYAQQARNTEAEDKAREIRIRAQRRMGELLTQLPRTTPEECAKRTNATLGRRSSSDVTSVSDQEGRSFHQGTSDSGSSVSSFPKETNSSGPSPYATALEKTGTSRKTANTYQKLAAIPEKDFEQALRDPSKKPTTARLIRDAYTDPEVREAESVDETARWVWGCALDFEREDCASKTPDYLFQAMTPEMQDDMRRLVPVLTDFYQQFSEVIR